VLQTWQSAPSARNLILSALSADAPRTSLQTLARIGHVFGVDAGTVRVTVGRLVRDGLLRQVERGHYAIGEHGSALQARVRRWRTAEDRTRSWDRAWIIVLVAHLGRTDRSRLRSRERALKLNGFAQADEGYWVRPDNLLSAVPEIAREAMVLGLEREAVVFGSAEALPRDVGRLKALWSTDDLSAGYQAWIGELDASTERLPKLSPEDAARESFLLGQAVIRAINLDPLLPAEMVDVDLRRRMVDGMIAYDRIGKECWASLELTSPRAA
jgi:phenylacetic acid degradation operon negative regulatory protein